MAFPCLEVACFDVPSARIAAKCGASRIELCANYEIGGSTPIIEANAVMDLKKDLGIPIFVMIRPRGGDYHYNAEEFEMMESDIKRLREAADGFVFGILDAENKIDVERNKLLVFDAKGKPCTIHRAFDETPNLLEALENAIECGFLTILTSGGEKNATNGIENLQFLVERANGSISVMPGGGIRSHNVKEIQQVTRAEWFHSAASVGDNKVDGEEVAALLEQLRKR